MFKWLQKFLLQMIEDELSFLEEKLQITTLAKLVINLLLEVRLL